MNKDFKEHEDLILHEFEVERSFVVEQHRQEVFRLENIIYAMEETFLEKEMEARAEFQSNMDELKNKVSNYNINYACDDMREEVLLMINN